MKKLLVLIVAFSLMSCVTTKTGTAKTMDIVGSGVMHKPVIADLIVKEEKITATTTLSNVESMVNAKNEVVRKALKEVSADVLVEPTFESTTKNGKTELIVSGWPANYKNFRVVEEKDIKFLEIKPDFIQKANVFEPVIEQKKKKVGLWIALGAILLGAMIVPAVL